MTAGLNGLTFLTQQQEWQTAAPIAAGKTLAVTVTVKMPAGAFPGNGYEQEISLLTADGVTVDGEFLLDAVTNAAGTHADDEFATVAGSSKTSADPFGNLAVVAPPVLALGKTTTATYLIKNDTGTASNVTTTISGANACANDFSVTAKNGTTDITSSLYSGYTLPLAAKGSVTITLTLKANYALNTGCNPIAGIWFVRTSAPGAPGQLITLVGNEQAT
jgi:hypothetical protein